MCYLQTTFFPIGIITIYVIMYVLYLCALFNSDVMVTGVRVFDNCMYVCI